MPGVGDVVNRSPATAAPLTPGTALRTIVIDVHALAMRPLMVQSFHARGEAPYLDAHEALRAEVSIAAGFSGQLPRQPLLRARLTIICYVGKRRADGYYRPRRAHMLHMILDPIYRALLDDGIVASMAGVDDIRVALRRNEHEGFRIVITEQLGQVIDGDDEA